MKKLLFIILICNVVTLYGQRNVSDTLESLFENQLSLFPQEKIYLHTDKPYYISGEKIWFRAYIADAVTHIPFSISRYTYVELINPLDSVVSRVKISLNEEAYYGHLIIPSDVPEGDYILRAYTTFMQSQDEEYFFSKSVRIGDPQARTVNIETRFFFESDRRIHATFRFSHVITSAPFVPKSVKTSINEGKMMNISVNDDGTASINFDLSTDSRKRTILLEVTTSGNPYRQFISIPVPDNNFDVSFYPEGGSSILGTRGKIAFKAMMSNGQATDVSGVVYNQYGTEVAVFQSEHLGMGSFIHLPEEGETYYVICENDKGESKRFDLPSAMDKGYALAASQIDNRILVSIHKSAVSDQNQELYLFAHTRGTIHLINLWDHEKNMLVIPKEFLPSGVLHLVLFDAALHPISERLIFVNNNDQAQVAYQSDKDHWIRRSLVKNRVTITDQEGVPLIGSFSVAVTSDREVQSDSTSNILTQLLLTSDLRGNIENPAYYFQDTPRSIGALDLLMCTQGWRRYNMEEMAQGRFAYPMSPLELGAEISGIVIRGSGRPIENAEVNLLSFPDNYFKTTLADQDGRFSFPIDMFPNSTLFMVSVKPLNKITFPDLILDQETFPAKRLSIIPSTEIERNLFTLYADKAEQQYISENGNRIIVLPEIVVTAQQIPPKKSQWYKSPDNIITEEEMKTLPEDIVIILNRIPGVRAWYDELGNLGGVLIRGEVSFNSNEPSFNSNEPSLNSNEPLLLVDDIPMDVSYISTINIHDIAQIDILKSKTSIFGSRGSSGVIAIHTKKSNPNNRRTDFPHIKTIMPLGYQLPIEFYAPKYETEAQRNNSNSDMRTTIHWQPVVQTDSNGTASFEFYTADEQTSYTVIIEGLAVDGTIIRRESKILR